MSEVEYALPWFQEEMKGHDVLRTRLMARENLEKCISSVDGAHYERKLWEFSINPEINQNILEAVFLDLSSESSGDFNKLYALFQAAILLLRQDAVDLAFLAKILENIVDTNLSWDMDECLKFLSSGFELFSSDVSSSKGHGLVVLRLCNEIIRRCPKSTSSDQIGFVLIILSKLFPLGERSGVNLRGDLNIDNVTFFEELADSSSDNKKILGTTFNFYREFWRLQQSYLHPTTLLQKAEWNFFIKTVGNVIKLFNDIVALPHENGPQILYSPKFFSTHRLFDIQLTDFQFREIILLQLKIFFQYIRSSATAETPAVGPLKNLDKQILTERNQDISQIEIELENLIARACPSLAGTLSWIIDTEAHWAQWKAASCPALSSFRNTFSVEPRHPNPEEPLNIEHVHSDNAIENSRSVDSSLSEIFARIAEEADPSLQIDPEYRISAELSWVWKISRFLNRSSKAELYRVTNTKELEELAVSGKSS